jgi:hypothetical protein
MANRLVWLLAAAGMLAAAPARGDVIYQLEPLAGAGATDNARLTASGEQRVSDSYTLVGGNMRLSYQGARASVTLAYRAGYTQYMRTGGLTTVTNNLALRWTFQPAALWRVAADASANLTRASGLDPVDPTTVMAQAAVAGSTLYLATVATEAVNYTPTPRQGYGESLSVMQVRYLEQAAVNGVPVPLPRTTFVVFGLYGNREVGRNAYSLSLSAGDSFRETDSSQSSTSEGHTIIGQLFAGWRRELSAAWSTSLQAGPTVMVRFDGSGVLAPGFIGSINYASVPWFASLTAMQAPAPNLFLGQATLSDTVMARVALPLTRNERLVVGAYGGYVYARIADEQQHLTRAYDQFLGGLTLVGRFPRLPIAAALTYVAVTQRGSSQPYSAAPDLARQMVLLSVRGEFAWGPGTPPLFGTMY